MKEVVRVPGDQTVSVTWAVPSTTKNVVAIVTVKLSVVGPTVAKIANALLEAVIVIQISTVSPD
jgi:hypothetical protein